MIIIIKDYIDKIIDNDIFRDFSEEELYKFLNNIGSSEIKLAKNEILFNQGEVYKNMCILLEGEVQLTNTDENGNRNVIDVIKPGQIFAEVFSFTTNKICPVSATASKNSTIFTINTDELLKINSLDIGNSDIIEKKYSIMSNLLNTFADKNLILLSKIQVLSRRNIREKIMHYLLTQEELSDSKIFDIPLSRKDMADFLGVDRSALSRELGNLRDEGIIDFEKNTFKIL